DGASVALQPLLFVDGENVVDGADLSKVTVSARVVGHERGPKLRVVKFKPKRGYRRRNGHRQALTRIEVTQVKLGARRSRAATKAPEEAGEATAERPARAKAAEKSAEAPARRSRTAKKTPEEG